MSILDIYKRPLSAISAALLLLCGCAAQTSTARFYILDAMPETPISTVSFDKAVLIGPVRMPGHLDRPNIVTRSGHNQLHLAEFHRWAGPLDENIGLIIAKDLSRLLNTDRVSYYLHVKGLQWDYRIELDIIQMDGRLDGKALLEARWTIYQGTGGSQVETRLSRFEQEVEEPTYNGLIQAWNRAFSRLSREIAGALLEISKRG